ncbi:hypothetical protein K469DRAFT_609184 [Zopfia rhizophila CBS 207.26]|uniref:Uncharacterized protein n=1 Tax=Zopfia rhizophila CBS 207.26 TaxID=1314779 RepID=A0A6A6D8Y8_9PEZI|nr:hypothetical protein K469DRAFT_609184 [Zopfia rhizophila CBS 207.26]
MAPQLRIHARQGRFVNKGKSRPLLRSSEPPKSPLTKGTTCDAVERNGNPCKVVLPSDGYTWCKHHFNEMKELTAKWKTAQQEAEAVEVVNPDTAEEKVLKLRLSIDLRRQVRERLYPRGGDTFDYIQWIMKLETDARALADSILMSNLARRPASEIPGVTSPTPTAEEPSEKIIILRSPLDPRIPINSLQNMPDDGTILVLKHFYTDLCADAVRRLYKIVPDLYDGAPASSPDLKSPTPKDGGTDILRAWFRIMIFNDSEAEALEHATKATGIDDFLKGCHASQLEMYCDFFEKAWRPHAVQYLRVAICAQTLAAGDAKTIRILGGIIPSTTEGMKMTKLCWDILYRWFPTLLTPWTLGSICQNFEDYTTICKLLMIGLYREHWFDPTSIVKDCTTGVYLGFIPSSKRDFTSVIGCEQVGDTTIQTEARNYVTGQMAIGDPLTELFLDEIRKRTERLVLVVYEGSNADATVYPSDNDLFVTRRRTAKGNEDIEKAKWTTEITLEDIKNDLRLRKTSMYDPIVVDSWQFIIIDKQAGLPFTLFDIIHDTLLYLTGDPSPREVTKNVFRGVIPPSIQGIFFEEVEIDSPFEMKLPAPPEVQYEGNRQRCWDPDRQALLAHQIKTAEDHSRDTNRFIRRVIDDMEKNEIVSLATEYERPQTRPIVIQGSDGRLDLYFPYEFGGLAPDAELTPSLTLPTQNCLLEFAKGYKGKHPKAIMAKGSIQTHYAAWPMPAIKRHGKSRLNFATWEGHIYYWNAMPFDRPWSECAWQYYLHHYINSRYSFVMFYLTTFVICAVDKEDAEKAASTILDEMEKLKWKIVLPSLRDWKENIEELNLDEMFQGIRPM